MPVSWLPACETMTPQQTPCCPKLKECSSKLRAWKRWVYFLVCLKVFKALWIVLSLDACSLYPLACKWKVHYLFIFSHYQSSFSTQFFTFIYHLHIAAIITPVEMPCLIIFPWHTSYNLSTILTVLNISLHLSFSAAAQQYIPLFCHPSVYHDKCWP